MSMSDSIGTDQKPKGKGTAAAPETGSDIALALQQSMITQVAQLTDLVKGYDAAMDTAAEQVADYLSVAMGGQLLLGKVADRLNVQATDMGSFTAPQVEMPALPTYQRGGFTACLNGGAAKSSLLGGGND
jgi:hypothetical protein